MSKITKADFLNWHSYYCPQNLIVSVVGAVDIGEIKSFTGKFKSKNFQLPKLNVIKKEGNFIEKRQGLDQSHLTLALHMPTLSSNNRYAAELFNAVLGEGMSSRLFREIREKRGLAYTVKSFLEQERSYGHSIIYAGIEKKNVRKVKELALKEIKAISKISARELEQAKEQKIGNWQLELEACDRVAINLVLQEIATKAQDFYAYPENISEVKLQDIKDLAKIKSYSLAVLVPK